MKTIKCKKKLYISSKWIISIILLSTISTIICLYFNKNRNYNLMYIIPLSYGILTVLFSNIYQNPKYNYGLGFWAINIIMTIRYIITPMAIIVTNVYGRIGPEPSYQSYKFALYLMVYEMIFIFIGITVSLNVIKRKSNYLKDEKKDNKINFFNNNYIIIITFLIVAFVILIPYPGSIVPKNLFIISTKGGKALSDFETNGIISSIIEGFKLTLFLFFISLNYKLYKKSKKRIIPIISLIILIIFLGMKTSSSRWALIINAIIGTYMLIKLYPKFKKVILITIFTIVIISFVSISIYKFYYMIDSTSNKSLEIIKEMLTMFEDYFSGPRLVAQSIEVKSMFNSSISLDTFLNTIFIPIPFVNDFFNNTNLINVYFNIYNLGPIETPWLIVPMIGEGYSLLGVLGAPLFTVFFECLAINFDYKASINNGFEFKYLLLYASIWCALCLGFYTQIIFTWIFSTFIPIYILFKINQKICLK